MFSRGFESNLACYKVKNLEKMVSYTADLFVQKPIIKDFNLTIGKFEKIRMKNQYLNFYKFL
jgi:hypothetical protein